MSSRMDKRRVSLHPISPYLNTTSTIGATALPDNIYIYTIGPDQSSAGNKHERRNTLLLKLCLMR